MREERRLVWRVLRHWEEMVGGRSCPRRDEIDPWMLGEDWANCLLIAVQSPVELSHFITVGENLAVSLWGFDGHGILPGGRVRIAPMTDGAVLPKSTPNAVCRR